MPIDPAQAAQRMGGGEGGMPTPPQVTATPDQAQVGGDINKVIEALEMGIQQAVDQSGYVDMQQLIAIWPQIAQQAGVNIPFETVVQLVQQNPELISNLIVRHGLAGIKLNGRVISGEQLAGMSTGAVKGGVG